MWQMALPMVMGYLDQRKAAEQQRKQQAAQLMQQSAQRLGAPSTANVAAAGMQAENRREGRGQFADLLMQLAGGQAPGAGVGDRERTARLLMQLSGGYGGSRGGGGQQSGGW